MGVNHRKDNSKNKKQFKSQPKLKVQIDKKNHFNFFHTHNYLIVILVFAAIVFSTGLNGEFVNWDDDHYIEKNNYIQILSIESIKAIFTSSYMGNYHPITTLNYAIELHLFGLNPLPYKLFNLILHLLNTVLVFIVISYFTDKREISLLTAFLFAIHPMHIESVTWVSERKDVLYTLFFLLSIDFYIKYLKNNQKIIFLFYAFVFFVLSLLSKSAAVVLPVLLLFISYYFDKRLLFKRILLLLPFFVLSIIFGLLAIETQTPAIATNIGEKYVFYERILLVFYAITFYITRFIFPYNFSPLHPYPHTQYLPLSLPFYIAPLIILGLIITYFFVSKPFKRILFFGFGFYIITIALVIQIIPVGDAIVAERYSYVPYIGLGFIFSHLFVLFKNKNKQFATIALIIFSVFLTVTTVIQIQKWHNSITLWTQAIKSYPRHSVAYLNRCTYKSNNDDLLGALDDCTKSAELNPANPAAFTTRAYIYKEINFLDLALADYNIALTLSPKDSFAYLNRGITKAQMGLNIEAIEDFNKAIEYSNNYAEAYNNRGIEYQKKGDLAEALNDFNYSISLDKTNTNSFSNRGIIYIQMGKLDKAIADFSAALEIMPDNTAALNNRALAYMNLNIVDKSCKDWERASELGDTKSQNFYYTYCKK